MRSKLNYLIGVSLKRKIKTKWFLIANIVLAIILIALINIDSIITFFGGDFNEKQKVYVIDNTFETFEILKENLNSSSINMYGSTNNEYDLINYDRSLEEAKSLLETDEDKNSIIIVINNSLENVISVEMITKEYMDIYDTQLLTVALNNTKVSLALSKTEIPIEEITKIYADINGKTEEIMYKTAVEEMLNSGWMPKYNEISTEMTTAQ